MACKPAFYTFYTSIWGKQYYQALFVYRTDLGQNCFLFFVFHNFAGQIALIQYSRRSKHVLTLAQQIIEVNHYKTFSWRKYHNVGTIQWDQSALRIMQGNNGLLAKTFKKAYSIFIQLQNLPIRAARFDFWQAPNLQCELLFLWMNNK